MSELDDFYTPKEGAQDRLESTRGFDPPQQATPRNKLEFEKRVKSDLRRKRLSKEQLESLGEGAYHQVPKWRETCVIVQAKAYTQYACRDHEKADRATRENCAECNEHRRLRRECVEIHFQPHPEVESTNTNKTHVWFGRIWWGVNEMTDQELKERRPRFREGGAADGTYDGLVAAGRRTRRLLEEMVVSLGREDQLQEKKKLDCMQRVRWESLAEAGLNVVNVYFEREPRGEYTASEPVSFEKAG